MSNVPSPAVAGHGEHSGHGGHGGHGGQPGGLTVSEHGYTLQPGSVIFTGGRRTVTFQVIGPHGRPVTDYQTSHDKELHFIAARRDLTSFQHVHPTLDPTGTWSTELDLTPGVWRFFADFRAVGHDETLTLGVDVFVAGDFDPRPLPPVDPTSRIGDYAVARAGRLVPGQPSELTLTVTRGGRPVTDLQPYLAAYGHLVALRVGDLAYLHVHPEGHPGDGSTPAGPDIAFHITPPTPGAYRLFLDFQHGDVVRTAEFTVQTDPTGHQPVAHPEHHSQH